jgi:hypothetical protein
MKDVIETITNLFKIKSIITLTVLGLLVYAVIHGIIEGKFLETIITMVFSFYFGTQYQKAAAAKDQVEIPEEEKKDA